MYERFTDRAHELFSHAGHEAAKTGHRHIFPAHLLLSMLRDPESAAGTILAGQKLARTNVELACSRELEGLYEVNCGPRRSPSTATKVVAANANNIAREAGHNWVGTEHVLLALLDDLSIARILEQVLPLTALRAAVEQHFRSLHYGPLDTATCTFDFADVARGGSKIAVSVRSDFGYHGLLCMPEALFERFERALRSGANIVDPALIITRHGQEDKEGPSVSAPDKAKQTVG